MVFECLFNRVVAHAWVESNLDSKFFKDFKKRKSLGVKIYKPKSLISDTGFYEFRKKFRGPGVDLSPMSVKMIRSARFSVALMPVMKQIGCSSIHFYTIEGHRL